VNRRLAVLRSVTIVSVATYLEYALGLVMSVWIARALGPHDFGRYAFTIWLCSWLMTCSNHALITSSTKFIAEADGSGALVTGEYIAGWLSRVQTWSSAVVITLFALGTWIFQPDEWNGQVLPIAVLVAVAVVAKANYAMLVAVAKGQERFETEAIATVVGGALGVGLVIVATWWHAGLLGFVGIFAVACLVLNLLNRITYRRYCRPFQPGPIDVDLRGRVNRHLKLTAMLVLLVSLKSGAVEIFLLSKFSTSSAVGFFAIAQTLTRGAVQLFSVGLTATLLPYMAKGYGEHGRGEATRFLGEATRFYWAVGLPISGIGLVTTPGIVTLMYGTRYVDAIPAIEATLVLSGLLLIGNSIAAFQTVVDLQADRVRIGVISLTVNVILGAILIPLFGLVGAVLTFSGTRITELLLALYYLRRATTGGLPLVPMGKLLAVSVLATGLAWLATAATPGRFAWVAGGVVFLAVYIPASVLVRYWSREDMRLIGSISARLGPPGRWMMRGFAMLGAPVQA
jgi:O-antigen/teichoic acid export membrane protein